MTAQLRLLAPIDREPAERWVRAVRRESPVDLVPGVATATAITLRTGARPSPTVTWIRAVRREPIAA